MSWTTRLPNTAGHGPGPRVGGGRRPRRPPRRRRRPPLRRDADHQPVEPGGDPAAAQRLTVVSTPRVARSWVSSAVENGVSTEMISWARGRRRRRCGWSAGSDEAPARRRTRAEQRGRSTSRAGERGATRSRSARAPGLGRRSPRIERSLHRRPRGVRAATLPRTGPSASVPGWDHRRMDLELRAWTTGTPPRCDGRWRPVRIWSLQLGDAELAHEAAVRGALERALGLDRPRPGGPGDLRRRRGRRQRRAQPHRAPPRHRLGPLLGVRGFRGRGLATPRSGRARRYAFRDLGLFRLELGTGSTTSGPAGSPPGPGSRPKGSSAPSSATATSGSTWRPTPGWPRIPCRTARRSAVGAR